MYTHEFLTISTKFVNIDLLNSSFPRLFFYSALRIALYLFYKKKVIAQFKRREKMIGHRTRFRENYDLPLW